MNKKFISLIFILLSGCFQLSYAGPEQAQKAVWANEAVVATYSYNYKTYLHDQKQIAKYFTAASWIAYTKLLNDSKLPEMVQKNLYYVTAVATQPPVITEIDSTHWQAVMDLLVVYKNPQYQQRQNLKVTLQFTVAPAGQGVRGYSISSFQSVASAPPCQCPTEESASPASSENAKP